MDPGFPAGNNSSKSESARLIVLMSMVILAGAGVAIPIINVGLLFLGLVSLIILMVRFGYAYAALSCLVALASSLLFYGVQLAIGLVLIMILPGIIMSRKVRSFSEPQEIVLWGIIPYLLPLALLIIFYPVMMSQMPEIIKQMRNDFLSGGLILGMGGTEMEQVIQSTQKMLEIMLRLSPGIFLTFFVGFAIFSYMMATRLGPKFGAVMPSFRPLVEWRASDIWLIPLGLSLACVLIGGGFLSSIGENLLIFLVHLYALYGICLLEFQLRKMPWAGWLRAIIYIMVAVAAVFAIPLLALAGLIDSRFDFRKIDVQPISSG